MSVRKRQKVPNIDFEEEALIEARIESATNVAQIGIEVAATSPGHNIKLNHPLANNADGECSFESVTDQLNNTRNCVSNSGLSFFSFQKTNLPPFFGGGGTHL